MTQIPTTQSLNVAALRQGYADGSLRPAELIEALYSRIAACPDPNVWISLLPQAEVLAQARQLETLTSAEAAALPLYGIPFAVKDNIDLASHPTTVGCPEFAYTPALSATVVDKLISAGALLLGKTNLDQFATGLVGTRSPYGPVANPFDLQFISGGSSSGSAVAVASGLVSFALGTDTAGSGRVPAGYTNIVGLKPTRGLISASGVFPACRTLDCVSIFALTVDDAATILRVCEGVDPADAYSRTRPLPPVTQAGSLRYGVPRAEQVEFFGNAEYARLYAQGLALLAEMGGTQVEIDFAPLAAVARLLYEGPWVAERYAAVKEFFDSRPSAFLPVIRTILEQARSYSAADAFTAQYRLEALRREIAPLWERIDCLALPTAGTIYTIAQVTANPLALNSNLGRYTNFANLLDMCALALPNGFQADGLPAGLTLLAPAFDEARLLTIGRDFQQRRGLPLGATGVPLPDTTVQPMRRSHIPEPLPDTIPLAVFGLHLTGQPLNHQLTDLGATFLRADFTATEYRLYAITNSGPAKPGAVRVTDGTGEAIALELWEMPVANLGYFTRQIPPPLGIGPVKLADGSLVKGFSCEGYVAGEAEDITHLGGWFAYLEREQAARKA